MKTASEYFEIISKIIKSCILHFWIYSCDDKSRHNNYSRNNKAQFRKTEFIIGVIKPGSDNFSKYGIIKPGSEKCRHHLWDNKFLPRKHLLISRGNKVSIRKNLKLFKGKNQAKKTFGLIHGIITFGSGKFW